MKTFESEFKELREWLTKKTDAFYKEFNKNLIVGLDSEAEKKRHEDIQEYNKRLRELKQKYNVD